jgi:hypothetical protein
MILHGSLGICNSAGMIPRPDVVAMVDEDEIAGIAPSTCLSLQLNNFVIQASLDRSQEHILVAGMRQ